ncbi:MAG: domain S-box [Bryobacterales bacterium]|nr:domain S-box [Bryobacterales bacterium]
MSGSADEPRRRQSKRVRSKSGSPGRTALHILDSMSDAVLALNREWRYTYLNRAAAHLTGHSCEEMLGRTPWEFPLAVTGTRFEQACRSAIEGFTVPFEEYDASSGRWFGATAYPSAEGVTVCGRDITGQRPAHEALRKGEERFRRYFELGLIGMAVTSPAKGIIEVNSRICEILGYPRDELLRMTWAELTHPDDLSADVSLFDRVIAGEIDGYSMDKRWIRKDGKIIYGTISVRCLRREDGTVDQFVALLQDVTERRLQDALERARDELERRVVRRTRALTLTNEELEREIVERKRAEEEVRAAHEKITEILESIKEGFSAWDENWRYIYVNERAVQLLGKPREQLIGNHVWDLFPEAVGTESYHKCHQAMVERAALSYESFSPERNRWYEHDVYPTKEGLSIYWRDITERKRVEAALRRSEAYLSEGQRLSHTASGAWNVSTGEVFWSEEMYRIYGFDPRSAKPSYELFFQIVHPEDRPFLEQAFKKVVEERSEYDLDFRIVRPDGAIRFIHSVGHPLFNESGELTEVIGTVMDVTERKNAEGALQKARAELAHVARISTMGELTSSIAHELNQPLGAIAIDAGACLQWIGREIPAMKETRKAVERIAKNAVRAADVIKRVRALVAKNHSQKESFGVNEVIQAVIELTAGELTNNRVTLQTELERDLPPVLGDRVQLQQVLLNLILNGNEAMSALDWPVRELVVRSRSSSSGVVVVSVRDSGPGLGPHGSDLIFDPFFSTKADGLGLGLSISRTIVEAHGGRLWATQNESRGATFHFTVATGA